MRFDDTGGKINRNPLPEWSPSTPQELLQQQNKRTIRFFAAAAVMAQESHSFSCRNQSTNGTRAFSWLRLRPTFITNLVPNTNSRRRAAEQKFLWFSFSAETKASRHSSPLRGRRPQWFSFILTSCRFPTLISSLEASL